MRDAVICEPLRTPVGRYGGVFRDVPAADLAATVIRELVARTGVAPEQIDDVLLGQCYPNGEAPGIGRVAALDADLPISVTGYQLDRRCGSGLQTIINAAMQVQTGASDVVLAGGVESMSQSEFYTTAMRWGAGSENQVLYDRLARGRVTSGGVNYPVPGGMLETAENLRREYQIPRAGAGRVLAALASTRGGRTGKGRLRRGDRPDHGPRAQGRHGRQRRRAPAPGHHPRVSGQAAPGDAPLRCRGHRDGGQFEWPERRCLGVLRHLRPKRRPSSGCARWPACGRGPWPVWSRRAWASARPGHRQSARRGPACHWPTSP